MRKYKLLKIENVASSGYDCYHDETVILKDTSDWVELSDQDTKDLLLYINQVNGYAMEKYVLLGDYTKSIDDFLKEGIKLGNKLRGKEEERQRKNEEKKLKAQATAAKNKKKKEAEELENAKKLLKAKGYAI